MIVLLIIGLMACEGIFFLAGPFPCSFSSIDTSNVQNVVRKDLRTEEIMNTMETKSILHEANITDHLNLAPKPITQEELQRDYNYYRAQKTAETMLELGLISLSEFNKLTQINRDTFSPFLAEIMPEIR